MHRQLQKNLTAEIVTGSDIVKVKVRANDPVAAKIIANTYAERMIGWNLRKKREEISSVRDFIEEQLNAFRDKVNATEEAVQSFKAENRLLAQRVFGGNSGA
jgi:uncharacterized protein involved in exopolysaccharide biosynthesis